MQRLCEIVVEAIEAHRNAHNVHKCLMCVCAACGCSDLCEIVVEAIEAHRSASAALGPEALAALPQAAREHALHGQLQSTQVCVWCTTTFRCCMGILEWLKHKHTSTPCMCSSCPHR